MSKLGDSTWIQFIGHTRSEGQYDGFGMGGITIPDGTGLKLGIGFWLATGHHPLAGSGTKQRGTLSKQAGLGTQLGNGLDDGKGVHCQLQFGFRRRHQFIMPPFCQGIAD
ncbi:MAG: hypothetical protein AAB874_02625 [Patescibacteria group bacterium]